VAGTTDPFQMVVIITATDVKISNASKSFLGMLEASLNLRNILHDTIPSDINPKMLNLSTSEAANSQFAKLFYIKSTNISTHIDLRSYDPSYIGSSNASMDFLIASTPEITGELNNLIVNTLNDFSEVSEVTVDVSTMYTAAYAKLILDSPTLTILINEGSMDLYRAAADAVAEVVEQYEKRA
jgi:hypothetical protein